MSSNYPPGVTGTEPEIVGFQEREVRLACGEKLREEGDQRHMTIRVEDLDELVAAIENREPGELRKTDQEGVLAALERETESVGVVYFDTCPFVGSVTQYKDRGGWLWECPMCGCEHEEER